MGEIWLVGSCKGPDPSLKGTRGCVAKASMTMLDTTELVDKADDASTLLSAMSNSKRLLILCNLVPGEMAVGALAEEVGLSQSALSQHLAKLRARRLVKPRRDAQTIYYSIASEDVIQMLKTLDGIFCQRTSPMPARSAA